MMSQVEHDTYDYSFSEDRKELTVSTRTIADPQIYTINRLNKNSLDLSITIDSVYMDTECANGFPSAYDYKTVTVTTLWTKEKK